MPILISSIQSFEAISHPNASVGRNPCVQGVVLQLIEQLRVLRRREETTLSEVELDFRALVKSDGGRESNV